ncbi:hypothetical protein [Phocaeicola plebeius]|jgi:hypothetical protein|uniref:hypothetical protein n=2 Tax=Phocaeicola plebeius TaxID=310297 RepID=UPI0026EFF960|nr:hypothetical protein [Phocaeicola plebeius]
MDDKKYDSRYDGETTDKILDNAKAIMEQTTAEDGETVQVYDTNGVPHKVSKTELLKKSTLALPALEDISSFVAVNAAGNAVGVMTKEQVASVLAELIGINSTVTTILQVGESVEIRETNTASIYLLSIRASASNTEYLATYILAWASIYAAGVTKLSEYSYTSNVTIEVSRTGTDKYKITYKAGNVSSIELKYSLRKLIL